MAAWDVEKGTLQTEPPGGLKVEPADYALGRSRRGQRRGPLLALEPAGAPQDATERLWIVDGTLIPVRDRMVGGTFSRNYRFSANVQVIANADTSLVVAAARPVPGTTADAKAWRLSVRRCGWIRFTSAS